MPQQTKTKPDLIYMYNYSKSEYVGIVKDNVLFQQCFEHACLFPIVLC